MARIRVVVAGAGVVGSAVALRLAQRGAAVTLVDAAEPGQGTSRTSFAWVNANAKTPRAYHELNVAGMRAQHRLAAELGSGWHVPAGNLEWTGDLDELERRVARLRDWGYAAEIVTADTARAREPGLRIPDGPVASFPDEAHVHTGVLLERLVGRCRTFGATVIADLPVAAAESGAARLEDGTVLHADHVVWCAGWRTPSVPVAADPSFIARTAPGPEVLRGVVHAPGINLRPEPDGRVVMEAGEGHDHAAELLRRARAVLPCLDGRAIERADDCIRPMPADGYPIVGPLPGVAGQYVVVTHSGITLAAHLAQLVAAEILDGAEASELSPYRPR